MKKYLCSVVILFVVVTGSTQSLSKTEQQIIINITTDMPATLQLLKESVNINSGTFNIEGVKKNREIVWKRTGKNRFYGAMDIAT